MASPLSLTHKRDNFALYGTYDPARAVGVDFNDTIHQTYRGVVDLYRELVDPDFKRDFADIDTWRINEFFANPEIDVVKLAYVDHAERTCTTPDPYAGARETLEAARAAGLHVVIVTSLYEPCVAPSLRWLVDRGIPHDAVLVTQDKTIFGGLCLLDDAPHNLHALAHHVPRTPGARVPVPVCFDQAWNRGAHWGGERVSGWPEFGAWLRRHILTCSGGRGLYLYEVHIETADTPAAAARRSAAPAQPGAAAPPPPSPFAVCTSRAEADKLFEDALWSRTEPPVIRAWITRRVANCAMPPVIVESGGTIPVAVIEVSASDAGDDCAMLAAHHGSARAPPEGLARVGELMRPGAQ